MNAYEVSLKSTLAPVASDELKMEYPTTGVWLSLTKEERHRLKSDDKLLRF